jgi:hypothetical protein
VGIQIVALIFLLNRKGVKKYLHAQYLEVVKTLIQSSPEFIDCTVYTFIEPTISSTIFYICADGYNHIFKAPFGLLESNLTVTALAEIIIDEVKEWRDKLNET